MSQENTQSISDNPTADAAALAAYEQAQSNAAAVAAGGEQESIEAAAAAAGESEKPEEQKEGEAKVGELDYQRYAEEFNAEGGLTAETYAELEAKGFPKEVVDTYIKGLQASASDVTEAAIAEVHTAVGGAEQYQGLVEWAGANLSDADIEAYNAAVANPATARFAAESLKMRYEAAEGSRPARTITPGTNSNASAGGDAFESSAQVVQAMRDPRYASDPAYRSQVQARLARSSVF